MPKRRRTPRMRESQPHSQREASSSRAARHGDARSVAMLSPPARPPNARDDDPAPAWPVVGIGASAECLEPLIDLLAASSPRGDPSPHTIEPDTAGRVAYAVVVLGLSGDAATGELIENLTRRTAAITVAARGGELLEPGHLYVVSGDRSPQIADHRLHLSPRGATRAGSIEDGPIDQFLESLAADLRERAIAVILAGAGDDGAVGVRAIRDSGGLALTQDPDTAALPEMPACAIASGLIGDALPVRDLGGRIRELVHRLDDDRNLSTGSPTATRSGLEHRAPTADSSSEAVQPPVQRVPRAPSLVPRTLIQGAPPTSAADPVSSQASVAARSPIEPPRLFRDPTAWQSLLVRVLEPLIDNRPRPSPLRVWVPGASTGADAFTVALLIAEAMGSERPMPRLRVLASESDPEALAIARAARFTDATIDELPSGRRGYFTAAHGAGYRLVDWLRETIVFAHHDLFSDPPFLHVDLIICRDLLSRLDSAAQGRALRILHRALNPQGALFLGALDTIAAQGTDRLFDAIDRRHRIFRALDTASARMPSKPVAPTWAAPPLASGSSRFLEPGVAAREVLRETLLDRIAPPSVLTDETLHVLYIHGDASDYLAPADGDPTADLLALLTPALVAPIRSAARRALVERRPVRVGAEHRAGGEVEVAPPITVVPIELADSSRRLLVVFAAQAAGAAVERVAAVESEPSRRAARDRKGDLAAEAGSARPAEKSEVDLDSGQLRAAIEELNASNEELEASREELQTMNEEHLQVNARLLLTKSQLETRLEELTTLTNDVVNLLEGTEVATVFLDREGCIRRFTPAARGLIHLRATDLGRPLHHLALQIDDARLHEDVAEVLATSNSAETVTHGPLDRWYLRRVIPYRTEIGLDGAVLTFTDITWRHRAEQSLRSLNEELEELVVQRTAVAQLQQDVAAIANSAASRDRAFAATLERLCSSEPWMGGRVYMVDSGTAEDSVWHLEADTDPQLPTLLGDRAFAAGEGLVAGVIEDGEPRFTSELESDRRFESGRARALGVRSAAAFPILVGERVVGAFELFSRDVTEPSPRLVEVMHNVGTQLGRVIEREEARARVFELAVEEQRSLGEELHDTLSQQVHGLSMLAQSMVHNLKAAGVDGAPVKALVDGLVETHQQIRQLSNGLVPVRVEAGGLVGALDEMARGWEAMHGVECVFEHEDDGDLDDDRVATALYRIAREAARNAVLHGGALRIVIRLVEDEDQVTLEVHDDGQGMETVPQGGPGMGLQIMRHRADHVGGKLEIESSPGLGTVVRCRIVSTRGKGAGR